MPNLAISWAGLELTKAIGSERHKTLIAFLVAKRKEAKLTQSDLAARLGESQSFVAHLESGQRRIAFVEFVELAEILGFDAAEVLAMLKKQA
jgi:transcriptional regulator with XRE-family HTH domain